MPSIHVLVIDDEPAVRQILAAAVGRAGYSVDQAATATEAAAKLARGDVDVALCDVKMPDGNCIDLLRNSRASGIGTTFIMITAFGSLETAVDSLRAGAFDYVVKPVHNEEVIHRLVRIEEMQELSEQNKVLRKAVSDSAPKLYRFTSPPMLEVERLVGKVAPTNSTVLITGESGTGKGVLARAIHEQSERRAGTFLAVNCSAIPEHLMESEFFGHTKGAFTSADRARKGLFLEADRGTLFLDEIGELPVHMQTKLLNVIEEKEVRPLGSEQVRRVDTRIIAATNRNLEELVRDGRFREDLYFRLTMFQIPIPPLRVRREDILELIQFLLRSDKVGGSAPRPVEIDPMAEEVLLSYSWPGNVRELENVINRACILAEGTCIAMEDLPREIVRATTSGSTTADGGDGTLRERLRKFEAEAIAQAIADAGSDRRLAARRLGIGLSSLYRKLEDVGDGDK